MSENSAAQPLFTALMGAKSLSEVVQAGSAAEHTAIFRCMTCLGAKCYVSLYETREQAIAATQAIILASPVYGYATIQRFERTATTDWKPVGPAIDVDNSGTVREAV
jgi:hypothetical protein